MPLVFRQLHEHFDDRLASALAAQLVQGPLEHEAAVMHQAEAVAQSLGLVEPVSGDDDGPSLAPQLRDVVENRLAAEDVEPARRLIEQHDRRIVDQGPREMNPLTLPRAQGRTALIQERPKVHQPRQFQQPRFGMIARQPVQVGKEQQQLAGREPLVKAGARRDEPHAPLYFLRKLRRSHPFDFSVTARRIEEPQNHANGRRLTRAVGPEQAENLARAHAKRQVVDGENFLLVGREKRLREFVNRDHGDSKSVMQIVGF